MTTRRSHIASRAVSPTCAAVVILSRDGLILGSYPDDETAVKPAWVRFASLGDPERSFVEFGDQVWVYVDGRAYGAFAVANAGVRPELGDRPARRHLDVRRGVQEPSRHAPCARGLRRSSREGKPLTAEVSHSGAAQAAPTMHGVISSNTVAQYTVCNTFEKLAISQSQPGK